MQINEKAVRERAYYIWEGEGRIHGQAELHWLRAEAELSAVAPATKVARTPDRKAEGAEKVAKLAAKVAPVAKPAVAAKSAAKSAAATSAPVAKPAAPVSARKAAKPKADAATVTAASAGKAKPTRARTALH